MTANKQVQAYQLRIWPGILATLAIFLQLGTLAAEISEPDTWMGRILIAQDSAATTTFVPQPSPIRKMVESGITAFTGEKSEKSAWLSLISTNDTIGIKVVATSGGGGTRKPVVEAVIKGLIEAGFSPKKIIVWDRRISDLRQAEYFDLANRYGVRVSGSFEAGFDENQSYETPLLGKLVYGDFEFGKSGDQIGRRSFVSALVSTNMTKIINIVPLLNHNIAGVVGCLHSLALGSVDNTLRFEADPDRLASAIPEIYALEAIGDKVVLNIVDALIAQSQGEERPLLHYSTAMNEIWFSRDPVALDVVALAEIARQRKIVDAPPIRTVPEIFSNAALLELGYADQNKFRIERLTTSSKAAKSD